MRQTENNEMDLLLRDLARREGARSIASKDHSAMHLDADELNSYAEQALPAAARARYTSHLADCASCRKIVSELTSASGLRVSELLVPQNTSTGLRQKVAALFSFNVLRYAVPALALFAFIAIGLVALRQQRQSEFVAQNQPTASSDTPVAIKQADSSAAPENSSGFIKEPPTETRTSAGKARDNQAKPDAINENSNLADSAAIHAERDAAPAKAAGAVAQPSYAPEPAAPPPPKSETTRAESRTEASARQKEEADKKNEPAREQEAARARTDDSQNQVTAAQGRPSSVDSLRTDSLHKLEAKRPSTGAKAKDDEADIRTVSGRRFRRQGGIWIDTAYQSSAATTTVSRGSEQFRALVADEPGIRAIAAQLPGEVVVVWKGRAYRIR
jgi:hypothetical protein